METDWYCPKCRWWTTEEGLKDEDTRVVVSLFGLECPRDRTDLETRPSEFNKYSRKVCDKPRKSRAMAVNPRDIPNAIRKWPGSRYDKKGLLEISSRAEKKIRMKQRCLVETD